MGERKQRRREEGGERLREGRDSDRDKDRETVKTREGDKNCMRVTENREIGREEEEKNT